MYLSEEEKEGATIELVDNKLKIGYKRFQIIFNKNPSNDLDIWFEFIDENDFRNECVLMINLDKLHKYKYELKQRGYEVIEYEYIEN
jgi:hypothetical protein